MDPSFKGYRRPDGSVGVRDFVAVIPTSVAVAPIAREIAESSDNRVRSTPHQLGTTVSKETRKQAERALCGLGQNPNVGAAIIVELGIEDINADTIADAVVSAGRPVETLTVRDCGGIDAAVTTGRQCVQQFVDSTAGSTEQAGVGELVVALECGGSDATSGVAANPAVGNAADRLVAAGGTVCLSEIPEFIGAEHVLADRCADQTTKKKLLACVDRRERLAAEMGVDMRGAQPSPGNQDGGLTTIEEKSLGAIAKAGTAPIQSVVEYGTGLPRNGGLVVMDTPGYDVESVVGKVAGGAQVVVFTTGRGSTTGNPLAPVLKVTGNPETAAAMSENLDVDVSSVLNGENITVAGERVFRAVVEAADGRSTAAECHGLEEFALNVPRPVPGVSGEGNV